MPRKKPGRPPGIYTFVPTSFGNRADPEPVSFDMCQPNEIEKRRWGAELKQLEEQIPEGPARDELRLRALLERVLPGVRNYVDESDVPIGNGLELYERGEVEFVNEAAIEASEMVKPMEPGEKKLSSVPPDSPSAAIQASDGAARSAEGPPSPPSTETVAPSG